MGVRRWGASEPMNGWKFAVEHDPDDPEWVQIQIAYNAALHLRNKLDSVVNDDLHQEILDLVHATFLLHKSAETRRATP